ncbi:DUF4234 domain-containing protein [Pseudomonas aeruginosa]
MENVYKTPEAPLVETRGAARAHFFVTSLGKMSVLFLVTLGLYGVYWMYKHWKAQQPQMEQRISPVWRAIFGIFFSTPSPGGSTGPCRKSARHYGARARMRPGRWY